MRFLTLMFLFTFGLGVSLQAQSTTHPDVKNDPVSFLLGLGSKKEDKPAVEEESTSQMDLIADEDSGYRISDIFSHPVSKEFSLSLQVDRTQDIRIDIIDAAGTVLDLLHQGPAHANLFNDFTFNWKAPRTGDYKVRIKGEDFEVSKSLMKSQRA